MRGVFIEQRATPVARSRYRADVVLFVGFVDRRRGKHLPGGSPTDETLVQPIVPTATNAGDPAVYEWLVSDGWARRNATAAANARVDELMNIPVPIDTFETFDRLFAWDFRPCGTAFCDTYLGAAVRSFFVQGGRLCYVVRAGLPFGVPLTTADAAAVVAARSANLQALVPTALIPGPGDDRSAWTGVWTVFGVPDASFIAIPDLGDVVRTGLAADPPLPPEPAVAAGFAECSTPSAGTAGDEHIRELLAPVTDDSGYAAWAKLVSILANQIALVRSDGGLRAVQLVAGIPYPADPNTGANLVKYLSTTAGLDTPIVANGLGSAFVQLAYPWLETAAGAAGELPGDLEPPEGVLCGALARNALERGTYRSVGGRPLIDMLGTSPRLAGKDLADPSDLTALSARATLLGDTATGFAVISDVTTSRDPTYRLAHTNRLMASLVRALRLIGEGATFEPSNARLWLSLRKRAEDVLTAFYRAGALVGATPKDAFSVVCDASTTSQDDIDNGRVIVQVTLSLAVSIQRLDVVITQRGGAATQGQAA